MTTLSIVNWHQLRSWRWSYLWLVILLATYAYFGTFDIELYRHFLQEDGWVEWATFLAFSWACMLWLYIAFRSDGWLRFGYGCLAFFCFFVAGEEISWAQRLLGYQPPEMFLEHNFQQESNLHNLFK